MKTLLITLLLLSVPAFAIAPHFVLASQGCPMAHCNPQLTDAVGISLPASFQQKFHAVGSLHAGFGLGCSSDGVRFVCAESGSGFHTVVYGPNGNVLWGSSILDNTAIFCAPMVGNDGGVIACDDVQIVRWDSSGNVLWDTCYYSGGTAPACTCPDGVSLGPCTPAAGQSYPSSPVQLANHNIVLAFGGTTIGEGASLLYMEDQLGGIATFIGLGGTGANAYTTTNTPCVSATEDGGNRFFVITNLESDPSRGRIYRITGAASTLSNISSYPSVGDFTGPSQASPLCAPNGNVYTDAIDTNDPAKGAVWGWSQHDLSVVFSCDSGAAGTGCPTTAHPVNGGFALDPRDGGNSFWLFYGGGQTYQRRSATDGSILQTISMGSGFVPGESCGVSPSSATMVANDVNGVPNLLCGLISSTQCGGGTYFASIDTVAGVITHAWKLESYTYLWLPVHPQPFLPVVLETQATQS